MWATISRNHISFVFSGYLLVMQEFNSIFTEDKQKTSFQLDNATAHTSRRTMVLFEIVLEDNFTRIIDFEIPRCISLLTISYGNISNPLLI